MFSAFLERFGLQTYPTAVVFLEFVNELSFLSFGSDIFKNGAFFKSSECWTIFQFRAMLQPRIQAGSARCHGPWAAMGVQGAVPLSGCITSTFWAL